MIKFTIPMVCPTMNKFYSGMHWGRRKKLVDDWHNIVALICKQNDIEVKTFPIIIATRTLFKHKRKRDTSNCFVSNKVIEDGLVRCGVLPNDSPEYVKDHIVLKALNGQKENKTEVYIIKENEINLLKQIETMGE